MGSRTSPRAVRTPTVSRQTSGVITVQGTTVSPETLPIRVPHKNGESRRYTSGPETSVDLRTLHGSLPRLQTELRPPYLPVTPDEPGPL